MDNDFTYVWYVSYGSNLSTARFDCYLRGGVPTGGTRNYEGCRDRNAAKASQALFLDGGLYFARHSPTWGGGMAFWDPDASGKVPAKAYLVTTQQLADVCAQEMRLPCGSIDLPIKSIIDNGRHALGDGHYQTLIHVDTHAEIPMITFTAPHRLTPATEPATAYVDMIAAGITETHGWDRQRAMAYLSDSTSR